MTNPLTIASRIALLAAVVAAFLHGRVVYGQNIMPPALPVDPLDMSAVQLLQNVPQLPTVVSLSANYPWVRVWHRTSLTDGEWQCIGWFANSEGVTLTFVDTNAQDFFLTETNNALPVQK